MHIRQTKTGRYQATVRLGDGKRRSRTWPTKHQAREWGSHTEAAARHIVGTIPAAAVTWAPDGLHIHIPDELITMDGARELEDAVSRIFGIGA